MIIEFKCAHCGNTNKDKAMEYEGALGYEAIICECCGWTFDHNGAHPPEPGAKGQAWEVSPELLAAAPDMLAALEAIRDGLLRGYTSAACGRASAQVERAIAKARGK